MRRIFTAFLYWTFGFGLVAAEIQTVNGNFSVQLPDDIGHAIPILEYLRRLERTVRLQGRMDSGENARELLIELDPHLAPGKYRWEPLGKRRFVLKLDADYARWSNHRQLGRTLTNALLRSRMGLAPEIADPAWPDWPADALWEEFLVRADIDLQLLRFTWLPGLRHIAEPGGRLGLTPGNLANMDENRIGQPAFMLYLERPRLMLEINYRLSAGKQNLLKDYLDLVQCHTLAPEACFQQVFGRAALQKTRAWAGGAPEDAAEPVQYQTALELLGERELFTVYAPLGSVGMAYRLKQIETVAYQRVKAGETDTAALEDLPSLVNKYETCVKLPRQKIAELNQLAALGPAEMRGEIFAIGAALANIGALPVPDAAAAVRRTLEALKGKIALLGGIDAFLDLYEKQSTPLLYPDRFVLDPDRRHTQLPPHLEQLLDQAEQ